MSYSIRACNIPTVVWQGACVSIEADGFAFGNYWVIFTQSPGMVTATTPLGSTLTVPTSAVTVLLNTPPSVTALALSVIRHLAIDFDLSYDGPLAIVDYMMDSEDYNYIFDEIAVSTDDLETLISIATHLASEP